MQNLNASNDKLMTSWRFSTGLIMQVQNYIKKEKKYKRFVFICTYSFIDFTRLHATFERAQRNMDFALVTTKVSSQSLKN